VAKARPVDKLGQILDSPDQCREYHPATDNEFALLLSIMCDEYVLVPRS
jgi:hypothetical protein